MAVSSQMFNMINIVNQKIQKLKSFIKDPDLKENYDVFLDKWGIFRESLNRHTDETARPILNDFNNTFNLYFSKVNEKIKKEKGNDIINTVPVIEKKSSLATVGIIIGAIASLIFISKNVGKK